MALLKFCPEQKCLNQLDGDGYCEKCGYYGLGVTLLQRMPLEVRLLRKHQRKLLKHADELEFRIVSLEATIKDPEFFDG